MGRGSEVIKLGRGRLMRDEERETRDEKRDMMRRDEAG